MTTDLFLCFIKSLLEEFMAQRLGLVDWHLSESVKKRQFMLVRLVSEDKRRLNWLLRLTVIRVVLNGQHW